MQWSDVSFQPSRKTLRQFACLWLAFFGGLAAWQWWGKANPWLAATFALLAATFGPLGLVRPLALRPLYVGWMVAVFPIGWTISKILMGTIYYLVLTPLGLFFRLTGRDALRLRRPTDGESYWLPKPRPAGAISYLRQF